MDDDTLVHICCPCNEDVSLCSKDQSNDSRGGVVQFADICVVCMDSTQCPLCGMELKMREWLESISTVATDG